MKIAELKRINLNRICEERKISGVELGVLLDASKQHAYSLLRGDSGIGDKTIEVICEKLNIDELEFVRQPGETISVDKSPEIGVAFPASFKQKNLPTLQQVEHILNSDKTDVINALKTGIKGVLLMLDEQTESVELLRKIADGQVAQTKLLQDLFSGLDNSGVPQSPEHRPARKKRAM